MAIDYAEKIPNNVNIANDKTLQRALEHWQPSFLNWWQEMGPTDFQGSDVYLRTAVSVDSDGTAGAYGFQGIATLQGVTGLLLDDLLANGNLIVS